MIVTQSCDGRTMKGGQLARPGAGEPRHCPHATEYPQVHCDNVQYQVPKVCTVPAGCRGFGPIGGAAGNPLGTMQVRNPSKPQVDLIYGNELN